MTPNPHHSEPIHFLTTFLVGGTSAALALTAIAPLERVKLILQTQKGAAHIPSHLEYKGIMDCFVRIPKEQGFFSFWRGNWVGTLRSFPYQAFNFSFKEFFKERIQGYTSTSPGLWTRLGGNVLTGGLAGVCALTIIYPLDFARTRMALDIGAKGKRQYSGISHCLGQTIRRSGITSIYKGYTFAVLGAFIYRALYFGLYDTCMECVRPEYAHSLWIEFPVAEFSSVVSGTVSYPLDTVRRRLMVQSTDHSHTKTVVFYKGTIDCFRKIWGMEGLRGFFHGGLANVYRSTGGALMLVLYDNIQYRLLAGHPYFSAYVSPVHQQSLELNSLASKPCSVFKHSCVFCNF